MTTTQIKVKRIVNQHIRSVWRNVPELFQLYEDQHDKYLLNIQQLQLTPSIVFPEEEQDKDVLKARLELKLQLEEIENCLANKEVPSYSFSGELYRNALDLHGTSDDKCQAVASWIGDQVSALRSVLRSSIYGELRYNFKAVSYTHLTLPTILLV